MTTSKSDLEKQIELLTQQNELLAKQNQAFVANQSQQKAKSQGIGAVWGSSTEAISGIAKTVTGLTRSGVHLADQAELHAVVGKIEGSKELLAAVGIDGLQGVEAINTAEAVLQMLRR